MVGRDRMGHRGSVDVAANEASLRPQRQRTTEHSEYKRLAEQLMRPEWAQLAAKGVEVTGNAIERSRTEDGAEGARQGAEGEGGKEGADLLRGGHGGLEGHGWEYLCKWEARPGRRAGEGARTSKRHAV